MKMKNLIKNIVPALVFLIPVALYAQDQQTPAATDSSAAAQVAKPVKKYVKNTFENPVVINDQTVETLHAKTLDFVIQHRFGVIKDATDLYGFFAPSDIRLGLTYGITDRLAVGVGVTKDNYLLDGNIKYIFLKQTKGAGMPVTLGVFGNITRSMTNGNDNFINQDNQYVAEDRLSYFAELMVARKFGSNLAVQLAYTYSYFNLLDSGMNHGSNGLSLVARYKVTPQGSVMLDFSDPLSNTTVNPAKPNFGFGYEIATSGHVFQIFFCTSDAISYQEQGVFNTNDFTKRQFLIGFNITRQWGF